MAQWTGLLRRLKIELAGLAIGCSFAVGLASWPLARTFAQASAFLADPWLYVFPASVRTQLQVEEPQPALQPELVPETAPEPESIPAEDPAPIPQPPAEEPAPEGWGTIIAQQFGQAGGVGAVTLAAGSIKNYTNVPDSQVAADAAAGLPFSIDPASDQPQVLIMHTHATETYNLQSALYFDPEWGARTTDSAQNMCAVGQNIADELNAAGIVALHDTTLHDYPSYNGSYAASSATVQRYLEEYPSIKVVLDVHRDAIERSGSRVKPVTEIEGLPTAQVMIICGCDKNGSLPNYRKNLAFAGAWEAKMEVLYPTLTRPVLFDYRYYNQDLTTGSLLIEVGGHANTLEEALNAGTFVGKALAALFTS